MDPGDVVWWRKKLRSKSTYQNFKVIVVQKIDNNHLEIKYKVRAIERTKIVHKDTIIPMKTLSPSSLSRSSTVMQLPVDLFDPLEKLNNSCPEQVVLSAASRISSASVDILMEKLRKAYREKSLKDDQLDLFIFFGLKRASDNILAYWGDSAEHLSEGLKTLDPNIVYFLRTGKNGHSGHYQLLYFEAGYWKVYSSPRIATANYVLTDHEGNVTVAGRTLLAEKATWGNKRGNYRYALTPSSEDLFSPLMDYIINVRLYGEDYALEQLF